MNIKRLSLLLILMHLKTDVNAWIFQPMSDNDSEPFISQPGNRHADAYREYIKYRINNKNQNNCCDIY